MKAIEEPVLYIYPESTFATMTDDEKIASHVAARIGVLFNSVGGVATRASEERIDSYKQANPEGYTTIRDEVTANLSRLGLLERSIDIN